MQRTVRFRIKSPEINLASSYPKPQDALRFPFRQENLEGTISLNLDPDTFGNPYSYQDDEGREVWGPTSCEGIIVLIEGRSDDDFSDEDFLRVAHKLAVEYVSKFVAYIQAELGQYWVHLGRMPEWDFWYFLGETQAKWVNGENESDVVAGLADSERLAVFASAPTSPGFYDRVFDLGETQWKGFCLYVSDERFAPDPYKTLISNAKRYFGNGDYRMAAVQAVTALDMRIEPFVERRCKARNISGEKFKETKRFIAEYLKVLLPLVLRENEIDEWIDKKFAYSGNADEWTSEAILEGCIALNKIRNNVAHKGKFEQTDIPKVGKGIRAAELLLEFMEESANLTGEMEIGE